MVADKEAFISCSGRAERAEEQAQHLIVSEAELQRRSISVHRMSRALPSRPGFRNSVWETESSAKMPTGKCTVL